jgi:MFS family permease
LLALTICALGGTILAGQLIAVIGSRRAIFLLMVLGVFVCAATADFAPFAALTSIQPATLFFLLSGLFGFVMGGVAGTLYAIVTLGFPMVLRATAIGLGLTFAKVGGVIGTLIAGALLSPAGGEVNALLALYAIAFSGVAAASCWMPHRNSRAHSIS